MKKFADFLIRLYKLFFSDAIKAFFGSGCRFFPTCSDYAKESIQKHGIIKGCGLSAKRLLKCNPFGSMGYDPVTDKVT